MKLNAKVKKWDDAKGYGFLTVEGIKQDVFVHYSSIVCDGFKTLAIDQPVSCEVHYELPTKPMALNVSKFYNEDGDAIYG